MLKSWRDKWENLSAYFRYHDDIRRIIYTTNAVEAVHRQFRKLTKTKGAFPNETSLLKLIFPLETHLCRYQKCPKEMDHARPELELDTLAIIHTLYRQTRYRDQFLTPDTES